MDVRRANNIEGFFVAQGEKPAVDRVSIDLFLWGSHSAFGSISLRYRSTIMASAWPTSGS